MFVPSEHNAGWAGVRRLTSLLDVRVSTSNRGIAVSAAARKRILSEKDPARLERGHERAIVAASVAEIFDEPSRLSSPRDPPGHSC